MASKSSSDPVANDHRAWVGSVVLLERLRTRYTGQRLSRLMKALMMVFSR